MMLVQIIVAMIAMQVGWKLEEIQYQHPQKLLGCFTLSPIVLSNTLSNSFHSEDSNATATTGIFLTDEIVPPN